MTLNLLFSKVSGMEKKSLVLQMEKLLKKVQNFGITISVKHQET
jgi:hypothetical protein